MSQLEVAPRPLSGRARSCFAGRLGAVRAAPSPSLSRCHCTSSPSDGGNRSRIHWRRNRAWQRTALHTQRTSERAVSQPRQAFRRHRRQRDRRSQFCCTTVSRLRSRALPSAGAHASPSRLSFRAGPRESPMERAMQHSRRNAQLLSQPMDEGAVATRSVSPEIDRVHLPHLRPSRSAGRPACCSRWSY